MTLRSGFSLTELLIVRTLAFAKSSTLASSGVKENVFPTTCNVLENFILDDIILFYFYFIIYFVIPMML